MGENVLGSFFKTTKEFKKLDEVNDVEERIKMKKTRFKVWSMIFFMRGSDKRKYVESIHDLSIKYAMKINKYPKTLQEAVDVI